MITIGVVLVVREVISSQLILDVCIKTALLEFNQKRRKLNHSSLLFKYNLVISDREEGIKTLMHQLKQINGRKLCYVSHRSISLH